jgi:hypothetical protein
MSFQLLAAAAALIWLASLGVCVIAFVAKRFLTSLILSLVALAIGYLGLTHFQINASKTVNGQLQWSLNSHWFFVATLILAALTLACTIWKHRMTKPGNQTV